MALCCPSWITHCVSQETFVCNLMINPLLIKLVFEINHLFAKRGVLRAATRKYQLDLEIAKNSNLS